MTNLSNEIPVLDEESFFTAKAKATGQYKISLTEAENDDG